MAVPRNAHRAVFFDVGDTLLDTSDMLDRALYTALVPLAPGHTIEDVRRAVAASAADLPSRQPPFEDVVANVEWWMERYRAVGRALDLAGDTLDRFVHVVGRGHLAGDALRIVPGAPEVLARLAAAGYRLGVISNWDDTLESILERTGLRPHFRVIVASTVFGHAKPRRAIFEHALAAIGAEAAHCWHVGDDPNADALGALKAGLRAVLLDRHDLYPELERAGVVRVRALPEVAERILEEEA